MQKLDLSGFLFGLEKSKALRGPDLPDLLRDVFHKGMFHQGVVLLGVQTLGHQRKVKGFQENLQVQKIKALELEVTLQGT